jgi:hypothetical protein
MRLRAAVLWLTLAGCAREGCPLRIAQGELSFPSRAARSTDTDEHRELGEWRRPHTVRVERFENLFRVENADLESLGWAQEHSNTCWAASARLVSAYHCGIDVGEAAFYDGRGQRAGTASDLSFAFLNAPCPLWDAGSGVHVGTLQSIVRALERGEPAIVGLEDRGHAVVVSAVEYARAEPGDDPALLLHRARIFDPCASVRANHCRGEWRWEDDLGLVEFTLAPRCRPLEPGSPRSRCVR